MTTEPKESQLLPYPRFTNALPKASMLGDESQWIVMRGHIPFDLAEAAMTIEVCNTIGMDEFYEFYKPYLKDGTEHTYVVELVWDEKMEPVPEVGVGEPFLRFDYGEYDESMWTPATVWSA